jgi:uncharacterized protein YndB with AHSA1/START domain
LIEASGRGVLTSLVTRRISSSDRYRVEKMEYHDNLRVSRVLLAYNDTVHAKMVIVDGLVAVVSSMNFISSSSSGRAWEAGLATINPQVVEQVTASLTGLWESRDTSYQKPLIIVKVEQEIPAPPESVFFYLTDDASIPLWMEDVDKVVRDPDGPLRVGSSQIHYKKRGNVRKEYREYRMNQGFSLRTILDSHNIMERYQLEPNEKGTKLTAIHLTMVKHPMNGHQIRKVKETWEKYLNKKIDNLTKIFT